MFMLMSVNKNGMWALFAFVPNHHPLHLAEVYGLGPECSRNPDTTSFESADCHERVPVGHFSGKSLNLEGKRGRDFIL